MISELTQSSINMFFRCGHQFYLRYVKGISIPPGVAARKGSSVHAGAEYDYRHKLTTGSHAPLDEVKDVTHDTFVTLATEEGCWFSDDDLSDKQTIVTDHFYQAIAQATFYHEQFAVHDDDVALVEERLYADIGVGMPVCGKPDAVVDGTLIDLKTSTKRWPKGRENTEIQPTLYRMLLRENGLGDLPAEYRILTNATREPRKHAGTWDTDTKVYGEIRQAHRTVAHEEALLDRIRIMVTMLKAGQFPPAYPDTWWCSRNWCAYFGGCPYVRGRKSIHISQGVRTA
jgi:hypothetical protein